MIRILMIYLSVLTFAEFSFARISVADETETSASHMQGEVVYADMKPVVADGRGLAPKILDLTNKKPSVTQVTER